MSNFSLNRVAGFDGFGDTPIAKLPLSLSWLRAWAGDTKINKNRCKYPNGFKIKKIGRIRSTITNMIK